MEQHPHVYDELLASFAKTMKERLGNRLKKLVLFGSRSRGESYPDSDYDLLVIVDEVTPEVNEAIDDLAGEFLYEYNKLISAIAVSEKCFSYERFNPLYMNIRKEGIPL